MHCTYCNKHIAIGLPDDTLDKFIAGVEDKRKHPVTDADALLIHHLVAHLPDALNKMMNGDSGPFIGWVRTSEYIASQPGITPMVNKIALYTAMIAAAQAKTRAQHKESATPFSFSLN